jgi:hypothetical protein
MTSFFLTHPFGTFLAGVALTAGGMGGAVAYYRRQYQGCSRLLAAILDEPEFYGRLRRDQWLPLCDSQAAAQQEAK